MRRPRTRAHHATTALLLAAACLVPGRTLVAAEDRGLHGEFGVSVQHDGNLFRLPGGVSPAEAGVNLGGDGGTRRADVITSPSAGVDAAWVIGRQRVQAGLSLRETRLARYDAYDARERGARLGWDWQLGNDWSGLLALAEDQRASALEDFLGAERNLLTTDDLQAAAQWSPRPDRRLRLASQRVQGRNSRAEREAGDFTLTLASVEGAWRTGLDNEVTLRLRHTEGDYPNREVVDTVPVDNSYRQVDGEAGLVLRPGGRTRGEVRIGWGSRRHAQVSERNFEGFQGRLALAWQASAAVALDVAWVRDLSALDVADRVFAVSTRESIGATWLAAAQWRVSARRSWRQIDDRGDPRNALTTQFGQQAARSDRQGSIQWTLDWLPTTQWQVRAALTRETRRSNRPGLNYRSDSLTLGTQWRF